MSDTAVADPNVSAPKSGRAAPKRKTVPYDVYRLDLTNGSLTPVAHDQVVTAKDGSTMKGFAKPPLAAKWARQNLAVSEATSFRVFKVARGFRLTPPEAVKSKLTNE